MVEAPAYLVALARLRDRRRFADYVAQMPSLYARFGGQYLAVSTAAEVEQFGHGQPGQSVVISRWPSLARLKEFWSSSEYRRVATLREDTGDVVVLGLEARHALPVPVGARPALALIVGLSPSPALFESGGASALAYARERDLTVLEGSWGGDDVALYGFPELGLGRQLLSQLSSGQRGRSLLMPGITPTVVMPCAEMVMG